MTAQPDPQAEGLSEAGRRYLHLLKMCITRLLFVDEEVRDVPRPRLARLGLTPAEVRAVEAAAKVGLRLVAPAGDGAARRLGREWPPPRHGETQLGLARLDNIQACAVDVINRGVPGDLIEAGVWRGGAVILMRAVLAASGDTTRRVWAADSFEGLPAPDPARYPADAGLEFFATVPQLAVGVEEVKANLARYDLLDDRVGFLVGWFKDTLPEAPIDRLAVVRIDGDLYESTMDAISALYPKLSVGGYVIVDDYNDIRACRQAVSDYRVANGITDKIEMADWTGVYWQKLR